MDMKAKSVEEYLNSVDYGDNKDYVPSEFALNFINFIKLVNGPEGEENTTPVLHYKMLDQIAEGSKNVLNMLFRGSGKTTLLGEYLFLYIAVYGSLPSLKKIDVAIYVSDSIENGVKNMRKNLQFRWENSEFLKTYVPKTRFTDIRWEFINKAEQIFIIKAYGVKTGVRGSKELGTRPKLAILDDLINDEDARSPTIINAIEDTVYKAVNHALHPKTRLIVWSGTPFNTKDPLYKAVESGAWNTNVYPVCDKYPCTKGEFRGAWEDRFTYEFVKEQYDTAIKTGQISSFNQELMLRVMSDEDRLVQSSDIMWFKRSNVLENKGGYNFYITTDFATGMKTSNDYSFISVWAYNSNGDWMLIDMSFGKRLMDKNVDELFRLCQMYAPQQVGVEVSGQQGGFIQWINNEMSRRNIYFNLASDHNSSNPGIRPNKDKLTRFNIMLPWFKLHKIWFPEELKSNPAMQEALNELGLASQAGFKSKHDDFIDTVSMLSSLQPWKPSQNVSIGSKSDSTSPDDFIWGNTYNEPDESNSYIV